MAAELQINGIKNWHSLPSFVMIKSGVKK